MIFLCVKPSLMTWLSVNVNKLATLRNSREKNLPDVTKMAAKILDYGAHGITVHPRPDGRHIRLPDVWALHKMILERPQPTKKIEFNIEGFPAPDFLKLIEDVRPDQCTLVPDPPEALTSNAGWDLIGREVELIPTLKKLKSLGVRSSLFVDPATFNDNQAQALERLRPDRIELYTEAYSDHFPQADREKVTARYREVSEIAKKLGIGVNAGHDLNQQNLKFLIQSIPWIDEVSIGHALICEALEQGLETTIRNYLRILS